MHVLGILAGFAMVGSVFFPWNVGGFLTEISYFMGIQTYAVSPFAAKFHFVTVLTALLYLVAVSLARIKPVRIAALVFVLGALLIAVFDIVEILRSKADLRVGTGLWIFLGGSLVGLVACLGLLVRKRP
jgi:hypothetical protein